MDTKICGKCKNELPLNRFHKRKLKNGYGYKSDCKECRSLEAKTSYEVKREDPSFLAQAAEYSRLYRINNPGFSAMASKRWRENNPGAQTLSESKWREANRDAFNAKCTRVNHARRARLKESLVLPFTQSQLDARLSMYLGCWMCGGPKEAIDHVKPICAGGPHILANLRPICQSCNSRKGGTWPI